MSAGRKARLAFVIPWRDRGRWIWESLSDERYEADLIFAAAEPDTFFDRRRWLPPYIGELLHLARHRSKLSAYDVVFAWELRSAVAVAILRRLQPAGHRAKFVPVGPILKGGALRVVPLIRWLLRDADRIICFSRAECESQANLLRLPREHFVFVPTPWATDEVILGEEGGYILALGHSGRDYPTLMEVVRGTELPVTIVARSPRDLGGATVPPNVTVRYNTGQHETNELVAKATLAVIPLRDRDYSAGQTVLLRAMAQAKAVVVTDTAGIRDYVQEGETAVLVPPGDVGTLRAALMRLWGDAAARERIGQAAWAAREEFGFPRFAERMAAIAEEIIKNAVPDHDLS